MSARRILVVDDNELAAKALKIGLEVLGYQVEVAHSGVHALEIAETFAPEIALLDITMPTMNGYEVGRRLRDRRLVRLIALSGHGHDTDVARSKAAGFEHHLIKPVDLDMIKTILGKP